MKESSAVSHLVIVSTTDEKSMFPCDGIDDAVATIERFRNEENVESCELFELNPISFEFKPYYHVALSTGSHDSASLAPMAAPSPQVAAPEASSEVNTPVLAAVESPHPFDSVPEQPAAAAVAETPFATSFDASDEDPTDLDTTLANAGVPSNAAIPPLPEPIPPVPAFGAAPSAASAPPAVDPFAQSPSEAAAVATGATSGFGFELDSNPQPAGFELAEETPEVADLFGSSTELPPPPPPPVAEADDAPKRGLFGR